MKNNWMFTILLIISALIVCRPGSEKAACKEKLSRTQDASLCGGAFGIIGVGLSDVGIATDKQKNEIINGVLIECLRLNQEQQKCKQASSYIPTIY